MANLREIVDFRGDFYNEKHYNPDDVKELADNILFLFEQVEQGDLHYPNEAVEYLKDIIKNYYNNVFFDFCN